MIETLAPAAAVQIAAGALDSVAIYDERDELADAMLAALARAGWLIPPNRRAALESVADVGWEVRCGRASYGDFYRALDALNAEPALGQRPDELCGSWPAGRSEGESASCILPRGHTYDTCRSRLGGEWPASGRPSRRVSPGPAEIRGV